MNDEFDKLITAFINRPIYEVLTEEIIDNASAHELPQMIMDNLMEKIGDNYEKEYEIVLGLNKYQQAVYKVYLLETEVNNSGYNQFYCNSSGEFYRDLPDALILIGAKDIAHLTAMANQVFEDEREEITKHQDGTVEGFCKSYEENLLNDFDEEFYKLCKSENLWQLQVDFIRKHKNEFIG